MNITKAYRSLSKQDKKALSGFTVEYVFIFSLKELGGRNLWWLVDSIHIGRWATPYPTDDENLVGADFWDNGKFNDDIYDSFMFGLLLPGKWK